MTALAGDDDDDDDDEEPVKVKKRRRRYGSRLKAVGQKKKYWRNYPYNRRINDSTSTSSVTAEAEAAGQVSQVQKFKDLTPGADLLPTALPTRVTQLLQQ